MKKSKKIKMLKISTAIIALFFFALPLSADETADFSYIYHKQCATCHGDKGDGQGRAGASLSPVPTNFTTAENKKRLSLEKIKTAIRDGVAGTSMSAYGKRFDENTLAGLSAYIQQQFMGQKPSINLKPVSEPAVREIHAGRAIYVDHCSACHGDNGNTAVWAKNALDPAPRNFTSAQAKDELSLERMITSVTYGRPGTAMMSFEKRLSTTQIQSVVDFIRTTFMQIGDNHEVASAQTQTQKIAVDAVDMNLSFPKGLQGDPERGEQFFQNNCFTCHGKKGDGKGPRSHFNIPRPRNFTSAESRQILNRPRLFQGISHGKPRSVMPAWSTVLNEQQIADVAEYVFQNFVQENYQKKKP